jgi:hypothetical protein
MDYQQLVEELSALESLDSSAFSADATTSQQTCDFVLALALAYNDIRDVILLRGLLREVQPPDLSVRDQAVGLWSGFLTSLLRTEFATVHELLNLIAQNRQVVAEPIFVKLERQLPKAGRESWSALKDAAFSKPAADPLTKALLLIRNKVGFHYDTKEIRRGFVRAFGPASAERPLLSRGANMISTRFYFADSAVQEYIAYAVDQPLKDFIVEQAEMLRRINRALHQVVTCFVTLRGFPWRQLRPHA